MCVLFASNELIFWAGKCAGGVFAGEVFAGEVLAGEVLAGEACLAPTTSVAPHP